MSKLLWAAPALVLALAAAPPAFADDDDDDDDLSLRVLSSPARMVTGGDALVRVTIPRAKLHNARVLLDDEDDD
jgi:Tannase-like family of unknown function (DUF6351)